MSEFSELIKSFDKIRDYMRDFYIYGFKTREQFSNRSLRSYDNEKRRIESYLGDYMHFNQTENGKTVFISADCNSENPFYKAYKSKTFTKNDITLNFIILDILTQNNKLTATEITDIIDKEYLCSFKNPLVFDLATVRNKLKEYVKLGVLSTEKQGKSSVFSLCPNNISLDGLDDAINFFSEVSPLGVIGSYLLDKIKPKTDFLSYKHYYITHALESEILYDLINAINNKKILEIEYQNFNSENTKTFKILPLKILVSVQGGRRYIASFCYNTRIISNFRLDYIKTVKILEDNGNFYYHYESLIEILRNTWGAALGRDGKTEHLSVTMNISEKYIVNRIKREGKHGVLTQIDENTYRYDIDVYDAMEMMPWVRTFIGRIISIECDNKEFVKTFYDDLSSLYNMYAIGEENDFS